MASVHNRENYYLADNAQELSLRDNITKHDLPLKNTIINIMMQLDEQRKTIDEQQKTIIDLQKMMDRSAFTLVLIDGDGMYFTDDLIMKGFEGGEEACSRLWKATFDELKHQPDFKHDEKIVIKVFANFRGVSKPYQQEGLLRSPEEITDFLTGFNKADPLCDFVDAGNAKEGADRKLQETLRLNLYNVHCRHIILGASADGTYASFLKSFHDVDVPKVRLLEGPPFAAEFKSILPKYKQISFPDVFRDEKLPTGRGSPLRSWKPLTSNVKPEVHTHDGIWRRGLNNKERAPPASISKEQTSNPDSCLAGSSRAAATSSEADMNRSDSTGSPNTLLVGTAHDSLAPRASPFRSRLSTNDSAISHEAIAPVDGLFQPTKALIRATQELLAENPRHCDFVQIKRRAADILGVSSAFWGAGEGDEWFDRSKAVIKRAVEQWTKHTGSEPPANATWLAKRSSPGKSFAELYFTPPTGKARSRHDIGGHYGFGAKTGYSGAVQGIKFGGL